MTPGIWALHLYLLQKKPPEQLMFFMQSFKVIGLRNIHDVSIYREEK